MTASLSSKSQSQTPASMPLVINRLAIRRAGRVLLNEMSWQLSAGQAIIIKGANGSGKTSLLRTIAGFIPPMSGDILLGDSRFDPHQPNSPLTLSYYGMADGLGEHLTGRDALIRYQKFRQRTVKQPDSPDIDRFSCAPFIDTEIKQLSTGQRQRIALTRLCLDLAAKEEHYLWLLDEPDSGLDTEGKLALEEMISDMLASGGRVMIASHLSKKMRFAHRVLDLSLNSKQQGQ